MLPLPGLAGGVKDWLLLLLGLWRETVVLQAVPVPATTRREHPASRLSQFQSVFGLFSIFTYKYGGVVLVGGKGALFSFRSPWRALYNTKILRGIKYDICVVCLGPMFLFNT